MRHTKPNGLMTLTDERDGDASLACDDENELVHRACERASAF